MVLFDGVGIALDMLLLFICEEGEDDDDETRAAPFSLLWCCLSAIALWKNRDGDDDNSEARKIVTNRNNTLRNNVLADNNSLNRLILLSCIFKTCKVMIIINVYWLRWIKPVANESTKYCTNYCSHSACVDKGRWLTFLRQPTRFNTGSLLSRLSLTDYSDT